MRSSKRESHQGNRPRLKSVNQPQRVNRGGLDGWVTRFVSCHLPDGCHELCRLFRPLRTTAAPNQLSWRGQRSLVLRGPLWKPGCNV